MLSDIGKGRIRRPPEGQERRVPRKKIGLPTRPRPDGEPGGQAAIQGGFAPATPGYSILNPFVFEMDRMPEGARGSTVTKAV